MVKLIKLSFLFGLLAISCLLSSAILADPPEIASATLTNDARILAQLKSVLPSGVTATSAQGFVAFHGTIGSNGSALDLIHRAANIDNVVSINVNGLALPGPTSLALNVILTANVLTALFQTHMYGAGLKKIADMPVSVFVNNDGFVFLDGTVNNHDILIKTIETAQGVPMVPRVISRMYIRYITVPRN